jgi:MiaB/RimO family radical SAM methylthiotransferase
MKDQNYTVPHKFYFCNKSCYRRQEEIQRVAKFLIVNGYQRTTDLPNADLVVFFTCGFNQSKVHEMIGQLNKIKSSIKKNAELMVGSCWPKTDKESLDRVFSGKVITPTDFSVLNELRDIKIRFEEIQSSCYVEEKLDPLSRLASYYKSEGFISTLKELVPKSYKFIFHGNSKKRKIIMLSKGCLRKCSYCAIRFATGSLQSKPLDIVMNQITEGLESGYMRFDLYADSIGDYGLDIGNNLGDIFDQLIAINRKFSIGIYDFHPRSFLKYFNKLESLCQSGKIHYLYVPLQSGNQRILQLMHRPCDINDLKNKLLTIKKHNKVFLQTSIIVGFPTETDDEFQDTVDFLEAVAFNHVYIHFYSDMPNTESSQLDGKIDKKTMRNRLNHILATDIKHTKRETEKEYNQVSD